MPKEILKIENKNSEPNAIDAEFEELETNFSGEERMELTRELFGEIFNPPLSRPDFGKNLSWVREKGSGDIKHFFLPDIPGGDEKADIRTIREGYDQRSEYKKSAERIFVRVGQGEMWVIPKSQKPYFQISMSECSGIIGSTEDNFVIAHISYSAINEIQEVLKFMKQMGIESQDIQVIASTGKLQKQHSQKEYTKRAFDKSAYIKMGIPDSNIREFEYVPGKIQADDSVVSRNLTQVIGCNDALFKYSFDLKTTYRPGNFFPKEEKIGEYKKQEIIKI